MHGRAQAYRCQSGPGTWQLQAGVLLPRAGVAVTRGPDPAPRAAGPAPGKGEVHTPVGPRPGSPAHFREGPAPQLRSLLGRARPLPGSGGSCG